MQNTESLQGLTSALMGEEMGEKESVMMLCLPGADWEYGEYWEDGCGGAITGVISDVEEENRVVGLSPF